MSITNRDVYSSALVHIGSTAQSPFCADYEERAPYLLANFCSMNRSLDAAIRKGEELEDAKSFSPAYLSLEADFPLCEKLIAPAIFYIAAMLIIDEDSALSDDLYDKYCDSISELSFSVGSVKENYFYN